MKNKALIGGLIALAIIVLIAVLCFWVGRKAVDRLNNTDNANVTRPDGQQPPPAQPRTPEQAAQIYLALGNPSNAGTADPNNYLLVDNYMAISYSRDRAIPNWVAWRVTRADMGDVDREDSFRPDDRLPQGWTRVTPADYTGSGYDRGHICPNADRNGSPDSMAATFLMTNMTPQTPDLNRGPWQKLEAYLRTLVTRGSDVYIVSGVYGENGKIKRKVTIPTNNWKVAVAVPAGSSVPSAIGENTRVIAVDMPNVKGIKTADWQMYRTTVRDIEQKTGYNLFSNLPQNLQNVLETKKDNINN
ncbi:MAG: DNA/RNA non-specific endonuclease [Acidobacteriota bacterium]|nr:DNA/RNA non-specific endonuclease [Acidobacteriota bacterium]